MHARALVHDVYTKYGGKAAYQALVKECLGRLTVFRWRPCSMRDTERNTLAVGVQIWTRARDKCGPFSLSPMSARTHSPIGGCDRPMGTNSRTPLQRVISETGGRLLLQVHHRA